MESADVVCHLLCQQDSSAEILYNDSSVFVCFLAFTGFFLWSSYCYGTPNFDKKVTIWNSNWIYGDSVHRRLSKENPADHDHVQIDTQGIQFIK